MTFLSRWREPAKLEARRLDADGGWEFVPPYPPAIVVTDRACSHWHGRMLDDIRSIGYLFLRRELHMGGGAARFVRGRWLWVLHRAGNWLYARYQTVLWRLGRYDLPNREDALVGEQGRTKARLDKAGRERFHAVREREDMADLCCRILLLEDGSDVDQMCIRTRGHHDGEHEKED